MQIIGTPILSVEYGSRAYGTAIDNSDSDIMTITVEPPEAITGLEVSRSVQTEGNGNDIVTHPLKRFCTLAAAGNPSILESFYSPLIHHSSKAGDLLRDSRTLFVTKLAVRRQLGFCNGMVQRLKDGDVARRVNRPDLICENGYDTKYAYHALRTAMQADQLVTTGSLSFPFWGEELEHLQTVRKGTPTLESLLNQIQHYINMAEAGLKSTAIWQLPEAPDKEKINRLMHEIYTMVW